MRKGKLAKQDRQRKALTRLTEENEKDKKVIVNIQNSFATKFEKVDQIKYYQRLIDARESQIEILKGKL